MPGMEVQPGGEIPPHSSVATEKKKESLADEAIKALKKEHHWESDGLLVRAMNFFGVKTKGKLVDHLATHWDTFVKYAEQPTRTISQMNFMADYINQVYYLERTLDPSMITNPFKDPSPLEGKIYNEDQWALIKRLKEYDEFQQMFEKALPDEGWFQKILKVAEKFFDYGQEITSVKRESKLYKTPNAAEGQGIFPENGEPKPHEMPGSVEVAVEQAREGDRVKSEKILDERDLTNSERAKKRLSFLIGTSKNAVAHLNEQMKNRSNLRLRIEKTFISRGQYACGDGEQFTFLDREGSASGTHGKGRKAAKRLVNLMKLSLKFDVEEKEVRALALQMYNNPWFAACTKEDASLRAEFDELLKNLFQVVDSQDLEELQEENIRLALIDLNWDRKLGKKTLVYDEEFKLFQTVRKRDKEGVTASNLEAAAKRIIEIVKNSESIKRFSLLFKNFSELPVLTEILAEGTSRFLFDTPEKMNELMKQFGERQKALLAEWNGLKEEQDKIQSEINQWREENPDWCAANPQLKYVPSDHPIHEQMNKFNESTHKLKEKFDFHNTWINNAIIEVSKLEGDHAGDLEALEALKVFK